MDQTKKRAHYQVSPTITFAVYHILDYPYGHAKNTEFTFLCGLLNICRDRLLSHLTRADPQYPVASSEHLLLLPHLHTIRCIQVVLESTNVDQCRAQDYKHKTIRIVPQLEPLESLFLVQSEIATEFRVVVPIITALMTSQKKMVV